MFTTASEMATLRTGQMLGGTMSGTEATEMVAEKAVVFSDAVQGAMAAATGDPRLIAMAMLATYQQQASLNAAGLRT